MQRALLDGFRTGRRDALEQVYWEHVDGVEMLVRAALRSLNDFSSANVADVMQEVFAKAFSDRARASYDGDREYGPYLRQIARNTLVDWLRSNRQDVSFVPLNLDDLSGCSGLDGDPTGAGFPADLVAVAERFVLGLEPALRAVHERRFGAAESQELAARSLGLSRQNLRTLERRLLDGLRRALRGAQARRGRTERLVRSSMEFRSNGVLQPLPAGATRDGRYATPR